MDLDGLLDGFRLYSSNILMKKHLRFCREKI